MTVQNQARGLRPFKPIPFGRYTLVAPIATGGMGEIFLARMEGPQGFEKFCVIKKILPHLAEDGEFVERFVNEAKTLVKLSHGSIAQVLDMGLHNGDPYIALEHVDGKDLRKVASRMREQGTPPPLTYVLYVMSRVLDALAYAHRKRDEDDREIGLVHRDISPQNVLVSYEGEVKVIDFGLAKSTLSSAKTNPSIILGKFMYMSPEQARHQQADRRSDLYSVGLCLYELIAGKNPFDDAPTGELMQRVASPQIPSLLGADPLLPPAVAQVVQRALATDPDQRYQTAEEFRGRLMGCLLEIDPAAGPESVSRFMREVFSGEFAAERRMLQALKEASRPHAPGGHQETGIVNLGTTLQPHYATPAAAMPAFGRNKASPLVQSASAQSRWRDNRDTVTEVATEHDVPVLHVGGYPGVTPQHPALNRGGMEPTLPRASQPGMPAAGPPMLSASSSEPTRRASIPEPPGSLALSGSQPGDRRHPVLRSREEITDPTRMQFQGDDIPEVSPDAVVDLLSEREATIRSPIPAPDYPVRVGLAVTLDDPLSPSPSLPSAPRPPLSMTLDDLRNAPPPPGVGPPRLGLGHTQDIPAPVILDKYKGGAIQQRLRVSGPRTTPDEPPPVEDLGSTMDLPGSPQPLRTNEPTDRLQRAVGSRPPRKLWRLAVLGIVVGLLIAGGFAAYTAWRAGAFAGFRSEGTPDPNPPQPVKLATQPETTTPPPAPPDTPPAPTPIATAPPETVTKDGTKDDSITLGPLRPAQGDAVVVRKPGKHNKLPKSSPLFREWNRTTVAFEELTRAKSCDSQSMGVICHRFEDLKKDIEAADSDTPVDSLIIRVRYMSESIAAKKAQRCFAVLSVKDLSAGYGERLVLEDVDLEVRPGELWAVLGPNGAGKSTLVRAALGLLPARKGSVQAFGRDVREVPRRELARKVAWVPQAADALPDFTALELVLMGRGPHLSRWALASGADVARARAALEELDIGGLAGRALGALSGGERRLVLLARALTQAPELLLLDEPTAFLDVRHQVQTLALVRRRVEAGMAAVAVLHDVNLAAAFAGKVLLLGGGRVLASGEARDVLAPERLQALYGVTIATATAASGQRLFAPGVS